jgi:hypothetical protein
MATHNATDGTGGMDASIRFLEEISRPEVRWWNAAQLVLTSRALQNAGNGFSNTINVFLAHANRYVSSTLSALSNKAVSFNDFAVADTLALALIMSVENW